MSFSCYILWNLTSLLCIKELLTQICNEFCPFRSWCRMVSHSAAQLASPTPSSWRPVVPPNQYENQNSAPRGFQNVPNEQRLLRWSLQYLTTIPLMYLFTFLKSVFPSFVITHWLSASNPSVFRLASFLYEWCGGAQTSLQKSNSSDRQIGHMQVAKISVSWWDKWIWAA